MAKKSLYPEIRRELIDAIKQALDRNQAQEAKVLVTYLGWVDEAEEVYDRYRHAFLRDFAEISGMPSPTPSTPEPPVLSD